MKYIKNINVNFALTLLLFVVAWGFWWLLNGSVLAYHEEQQLFLFDSEMFMERVVMPAGIARYIAEFFVALYNKIWLGAAIIAAFYAILQLITWLLARKTCKSSLTTYALSFVPVMLLWFDMCDIKMKLTFVVALLIAELAMLGASYLRPDDDSKGRRLAYIAYLVVVTPALAWIAGPTVLVFGLYVTLTGLRKPFDYISMLAVVYAPVCIILTSAFAVAQFERLFYGLNYSLVVEEFPTRQYVVMVAFAVMPYIISFVPEFQNEQKARKIGIATAVVVAIAGFALVHSARNPKEIEILDYNRMVRAQDWEAIIDRAQHKTPDTPLPVASLNLALAAQGQLLTRAFDFYQNGWVGVFPKFNKYYEVSVLTSDISFYLGLINNAQRLDFEAMEGLPDNAKSVRCLKRLAETNLVNGKYAVARRYLDLLKETMFYRGWAERTEALIDNEKAISEHPLYGPLRKYRLGKCKFVFSEDELDKICGQLLMHNPNNVMAMEYLLLLPQLEGNRAKYNAYMEFVRKHCPM